MFFNLHLLICFFSRLLCREDWNPLRLSENEGASLTHPHSRQPQPSSAFSEKHARTRDCSRVEANFLKVACCLFLTIGCGFRNEIRVLATQRLYAAKRFHGDRKELLPY